MLINKSQKEAHGLDDPKYERNWKELFKNYFMRDAWIDILANIPIVLYFIVWGYPTTEEEVYEFDDYKLFWLCMGLKTLRLFHIDETIDVLKRIIEKLADIFYLYRYFFENLLSWALAGMLLFMSMHYMACIWILISIMKEVRGMDYSEFTDNKLMTVYVDALYTMTTTISTVGYGDFKGFYDNEAGWTIEMTYLIFAIIFGIVLFSSITNEIFNYKSLKTEIEIAKKEGKEL